MQLLIGNVTLQIKAESSQFIETESTSFVCLLNGMGASQIKSVSWYKDDLLINELTMHNAQLENLNMRLKLSELSHSKDNGIYHCSVELKNSQIVLSNKIELETKCKYFR